MPPKGSFLFTTIGSLEHALTENINKNIRLDILEVIQENKNLSPNSMHGFYFRGELFHSFAQGVPTKGVRFGTLNGELIPKMDAILKRRKDTQFEINRIKNGLSILLAQATTPQEVRDSIPNCLADLVPGLADLPRLSDEAYLIKNDYQKYRQYMNIKPLIELYCALRLFQ